MQAIGHVAHGRLLLVRRLQKFKRVDTDPGGDPLKRAQREVALAALQTAPVRPVHTYGVREGLLGLPSGLAQPAQVDPEPSLQLAVHVSDRLTPLRIGLQTYE